jgi:hypothetical protein
MLLLQHTMITTLLALIACSIDYVKKHTLQQREIHCFSSIQFCWKCRLGRWTINKHLFIKYAVLALKCDIYKMKALLKAREKKHDGCHLIFALHLSYPISLVLRPSTSLMKPSSHPHKFSAIQTKHSSSSYSAYKLISQA